MENHITKEERNDCLMQNLLLLMRIKGCKEGSLHIECKSKLTEKGDISWTAKASIINNVNTRVVYESDTACVSKEDAEYRVMRVAEAALLKSIMDHMCTCID